MRTPEEITRALERILPFVQKPARYTGGEYNSVVKAWDDTPYRLALVFPDIYDLGMSNLGLMILYDIANRQGDMLAERAFLPWVDMLDAMQRHGVPMYSLESRHPLRDFDVVGFSLPYEQLYTNVLTALDLAGIPLLASDRGQESPLVLAGGSACLNPEPMHAFFDAFFIGEGEEAIADIVRVWTDARRTGLTRTQALRELARLRGIYVPGFYRAAHRPDGTLDRLTPLPEHADVARPRVVRQIVPALPPPPTRLIVPFIDVVHNRATVEIQRGCTRGCRFCQAGIVYRPVRERPLPEVLEAVERVVSETGFEEVSFLSLSSSDYSAIEELAGQVADRYSRGGLSVGLPSLRIDTVSVALMERLAGSRRRSAFTFAPEAATDRLRDVINKPVSTQALLDVAAEVFRRGWPGIKLYFMIGHPTQTLEDVEAIAELAQAVRRLGAQILGKKASVRVGVSTLVPKPHTPFQWLPMADESTIRAQIALLERRLRGPGLSLSWNSPEQTQLEAVLSRGDRRLSAVIRRAWELGARFDAWGDQFRVAAWRQAFAEAGLDPDWYARRERAADEVLPWDHIGVGVTKEFLWREYQRALAGQVTADCRQGANAAAEGGRCHACGILVEYGEERLTAGNGAWGCPPLRPGQREKAHMEARSE